LYFLMGECRGGGVIGKIGEKDKERGNTSWGGGFNIVPVWGVRQRGKIGEWGGGVRKKGKGKWEKEKNKLRQGGPQLLKKGEVRGIKQKSIKNLKKDISLGGKKRGRTYQTRRGRHHREGGGAEKGKNYIMAS